MQWLLTSWVSNFSHFDSHYRYARARRLDTYKLHPHTNSSLRRLINTLLATIAYVELNVSARQDLYVSGSGVRILRAPTACTDNCTLTCLRSRRGLQVVGRDVTLGRRATALKRDLNGGRQPNNTAEKDICLSVYFLGVLTQLHN